MQKGTPRAWLPQIELKHIEACFLAQHIEACFLAQHIP